MNPPLTSEEKHVYYQEALEGEDLALYLKLVEELTPFRTPTQLKDWMLASPVESDGLRKIRGAALDVARLRIAESLGRD